MGFSPDPPLAQDPVALCSSTPHMERPIQENRPVALPLPISLRRPEMVRLGATPATECVLSMEASSSTHTLLYKDGEDTASSELIQTTTRNPSGRKPDDRGEKKCVLLLSRKSDTQMHMPKSP
uniref:Uncharacterized protein n=1 Tax=Triticum urartu TaxID=4572 RepID=A0A8R7QQV6_TRIUA